MLERSSCSNGEQKTASAISRTMVEDQSSMDLRVSTESGITELPSQFCYSNDPDKSESHFCRR